MAGEFHPICIALAGFTASGDFHSALRTKKEIAGMIVPYPAGGVKPDADPALTNSRHSRETFGDDAGLPLHMHAASRIIAGRVSEYVRDCRTIFLSRCIF